MGPGSFPEQLSKTRSLKTDNNEFTLKDAKELLSLLPAGGVSAVLSHNLCHATRASESGLSDPNAAKQHGRRGR